MKQILSLVLILASLGYAQLPIAKPQPSAPTYSISELEIFPTHTRDSYSAATGAQAPPFNSARAPKFWYDSRFNCTSDNTLTISYNALVEGKYNVIKLPTCEASMVNIPGKYNFPIYFTAPAKAWVYNGLSQVSQIDSELLSTFEQAEQLRKEFGDDTLLISEGSLAAPFWYVYDPSEPRRLFLLDGDYVGWYLKQRNERGVGYPGKWGRDNTGHFVFTFNTIPEGPSVPTPAIPVPVRELQANETLDQTLFGLVVKRVDLAPKPSEGGFTEEDRKLLKLIQATQEALNKTLGAKQ